MIPVICKVKHEPPVSYGDCVRACVASILEMNSEDVPHFYHDGNGEESFNRLREFLAKYGRIPAFFPLSGELELIDVFEFMTSEYHNTEYLIFCQTRDGDHCVIGCNNEIIHNPAWYKTAILGPHSSGQWVLIILAKL